jgi:tetratricopeptide (TPR) repeat protein
LDLIYRHKGNLQAAYEYAKNACKIALNVVGRASQEFFDSASHLAAVYYKSGHIHAAIEVQNRLLDSIRSSLGTENDVYLKHLSQLVEFYTIQGKLTDCLELYKKILNSSRLGDELKINTYFKLGNLYLLIGNHKQAKYYVDKALVLKEKCPNGESINVSLNDIGLIYRESGEYDKAEKYFKEALELESRTWSINTSNYANILTNLAGLILQRSPVDWRELERIIEVIENIKEEIIEPSVYSRILNTKAIIALEFKNQPEEAIVMFNQALSLTKECYGENSIHYCQALLNIGLSCKNNKLYDKAEDYLLKAYDINLSLLGGNPSSNTSVVRCLVELYRDSNNFLKAKDWQMQLIEHLKSSFGEYDDRVLDEMQELGELYSYFGETTHASEIYSDVFEIRSHCVEKHISLLSKATSKLALENGKNDLNRILTCIETAYKQLGSVIKQELSSSMRDSVSQTILNLYLNKDLEALIEITHQLHERTNSADEKRDLARFYHMKALENHVNGSTNQYTIWLKRSRELFEQAFNMYSSTITIDPLFCVVYATFLLQQLNHEDNYHNKYSEMITFSRGLFTQAFTYCTKKIRNPIFHLGYAILLKNSNNQFKNGYHDEYSKIIFLLRGVIAIEKETTILVNQLEKLMFPAPIQEVIDILDAININLTHLAHYLLFKTHLTFHNRKEAEEQLETLKVLSLSLEGDVLEPQQLCEAWILNDLIAYAYQELGSRYCAIVFSDKANKYKCILLGQKVECSVIV